MLQPSDELPINLSINEWNEVLSACGKAPYEKIAQIIMKINQQAQSFAQQQEGEGRKEIISNGPAPMEPRRPGKSASAST